MKNKLFVLLSSIFVISCSSSANLKNIKEDDNPYCLVSFNSEGGSFINSQKVIKGQKANRPSDDPTRKDYAFSGWFSDESLTTTFDFNSFTINNDITIYAKWTEDFYNFSFTGTNCSIKQEKNYSEKVQKNATDVTYTVIADEGCYLSRLIIPGCEFTLNESKTIGTLVIKQMNKDYTISINAEAKEKVHIQFGGTHCTVNGKLTTNILDIPLTDDCDYTFYVKPHNGWKLPIDDEVKITSGTQTSVDGVTYHEGVIKVTKLLSNVDITADAVFEGYKVTGFTSGCKFTIDGTQYDSYYEGKITDYAPSTNKLEINYDSSVDLDKDLVVVKENGVDKEFDFNSVDHKITIKNIEGDIFFNILNKALDRKVTISFDKDIVDNCDVLYHKNKLNIESGSVVVEVPNVTDQESYQNYELFDFIPKLNSEKIISDFKVTSSSGSSSYTFVEEDKSSLLVNLKDDMSISPKTSKYRSFGNMSWESINKIISEDKASDVFKVGDTKEVVLSEDGVNQPFAHTVRIVGFKQDDIANGGGKASISLEFADLLTHSDGSLFKLKWGKNGEDYKCYRDCNIFTFLNETVPQMLPYDLRASIKPVTKYYDVKDDYGGHQECSDVSLFAITCKEFGGTAKIGGDSEKCETYQYYINTDNSRRIKKSVTGEENSYFTRSCGNSIQMIVSTDGELDDLARVPEYDGKAISFGFAI